MRFSGPISSMVAHRPAGLEDLRPLVSQRMAAGERQILINKASFLGRRFVPLRLVQPPLRLFLPLHQRRQGHLPLRLAPRRAALRYAAAGEVRLLDLTKAIFVGGWSSSTGTTASGRCRATSVRRMSSMRRPASPSSASFLPKRWDPLRHALRHLTLADRDAMARLAGHEAMTTRSSAAAAGRSASWKAAMSPATARRKGIGGASGGEWSSPA